MLVLDSGGVTRLAARNAQALALIRGLVAADLWPPVVPTVVLVECLQGRPDRDANVNRFIKTCIVEPSCLTRLRVGRLSCGVERAAARLLTPSL